MGRAKAGQAAQPSDHGSIRKVELERMRKANRLALYDMLTATFQESAMTRTELARRLGKSPSQITRWLGAPGNMTLDAISDLTLALGGAALEFRIEKPEDENST